MQALTHGVREFHLLFRQILLLPDVFPHVVKLHRIVVEKLEELVVAHPDRASRLVVEQKERSLTVGLRPTIATAARRFDRRWNGTLACPNETRPVTVTVDLGRFTVDAGNNRLGRGLIDQEGRMLIRKAGDGTFFFSGRREGSVFRLRGRIGAAACQLILG